MRATFRVQVWRGDHWVTLWRGFSYERAIERLQLEKQWYAGKNRKFRIAIP